MLRLIVVLLIIANGAFYAWTHDMLRDFGWSYSQQTEPQRVAQEIEPNRIRILDKSETLNAAKPFAPKDNPAVPPVVVIAASQCLQIGAFNEKQRDALLPQLKAQLPLNAWRFDELTADAGWLIYMGKYANNSTFELKKSELRKMNLAFIAFTEGPLAPGISLGSHPSQAGANQALAQLGKRGIRTARVVQKPEENKSFQLVIPVVDEAMRVKLTALQSQFAGKVQLPCKAKT